MFGVRIVQQVFFFTVKNDPALFGAPTVPTRSSSSISLSSGQHQPMLASW